MPSVLSLLKNHFRRLFTVDTRSLALLRVGLGVLLVCDIYLRAQFSSDHYTDLGLLPRGALLSHFLNKYSISLHFINGAEWFPLALFFLAFLASLSLIIGYKTRVSSILLWIFVISLQNRNPLILQGGDVLFRILLFWAMFLPLGATFSVDAALLRENPRPRKICSAATFGIMMQIGILYLFASLLKTGAVWENGEAVKQALLIDQFTKPLGYVVLKFPLLLNFISYFTIFSEFAAFFLLFSPVYSVFMRCFALVCLTLLHMGIFLTMEIGLFPWIDCISLVIFIPRNFWIAIKRALKPKNTVQIFYDGACNFCEKGIYLLREFLLFPRIRIRPAQLVKDVESLMLAKNSWIILDSKKNYFFGYLGLVKVIECSPYSFLRRILYQRYFLRWGEKFYVWVATRRRLFSLFSRSLKAEKHPFFSLRSSTQVFLYCIVGMVVYWNIAKLPSFPWITPVPKSMQALFYTLRLDQKWGMFAPFPSVNDGWYVMPGKLRDATVVDVFKEMNKSRGMFGGVKGISIDTLSELTWEKPDLVSSTYLSQRWRKYLMNIVQKEHKKHRLYYGRYLCRLWNSSVDSSKELVEFKIYFMLEKTVEGKVGKPLKTMIWRHECFAK